MSALEQPAERHGAVDAVAGLLAAASIFLSALGAGAGLLLELPAHPARVIPVALVLAIVAGRMSAKYERLARVAIGISMVAWVLGMSLAVITENPLL